MIKAFFLFEANRLESDRPDIRKMFPVVTSTKQLNPREIEIKWIWILWDFYNEIPYKEETIIISREQSKAGDLIMDSFTDFGFKQETT